MSAKKWGRVTVDDLEQILLTLPRPSGPLPEGENVFWEHKSGSRFVVGTTPETLEELKTWEVRDDDVFLVSFPKAGTTWMQEILRLIHHAEDIESGTEIEKHLFSEILFLESTMVNDPDQIDMIPPTHLVLETVPSPRIIKTHLEADWLPPTLTAGVTKGKIVYVSRNPKDLAVSYYHFCNNIRLMPDYDKFSDFLHEFIENKVYGGDWFKENLYWWNRRQEDDNVLFVKYEDMQHDLRAVVVQVCNFLEKTLSDELIDKIVDMTSFISMKNNPMSNPDTLGVYDDPTKSFMRKGQIGDWKNHFTVADNEEFDALYQSKMAGTSLTFDFGP